MFLLKYVSFSFYKGPKSLILKRTIAGDCQCSEGKKVTVKKMIEDDRFFFESSQVSKFSLAVEP